MTQRLCPTLVSRTAPELAFETLLVLPMFLSMDTLGLLFEQAYDLNAEEVETLQGGRVLIPGGAGGKRKISAPCLASFGELRRKWLWVTELYIA